MGLLRSLMFIPGNRERMLAKTVGTAADAVIWDLEDAVVWEEKQAARELVRSLLGSLGPQIAPSTAVYVRVNQLAAGVIDEDLSAVSWPRLDGVVLPKTEAADDVKLLDGLLARMEVARGLPPGRVRIVPLVETALGVVNAYQVASASSRVEALCFGAEDLAADLAVPRTTEGREILHARGAVVLAATAAGVEPADTVYTRPQDLEGLEEDCTVARSLGFKGKLAIHPRQLETINRMFSPSEAELDFARRVVAAFDDPSRSHTGVILVDGTMVDRPVVERARRLLERAQSWS